jgi:hypothetical protein
MWFSCPSPRPSIAGLFIPSSPSTILRRIGTVVIDTIQRISRARPLPHVPVERLEGIYPLEANCDATTPVVFPFLARRVQAAILHVQPRGIFWTTAPTMFSSTFFGHFAAEAAAGNYPAVAQIGRGDESEHAAIASTADTAISMCGSFSLSDNDQPSETLALRENDRTRPPCGVRLRVRHGLPSVSPFPRLFASARGLFVCSILPVMTSKGG